MVTASRQFVCIRPATYENAAEAALLKSLFAGPTGELKNTVFAILDPTGKKTLVRAGRSPKRIFRDAASFAARLVALSAQYSRDTPYSRDSKKTSTPQAMPWMSNLRLALNVAACDQIPLLVVIDDSREELERWEKKLAVVFWSPELIGRMHCVAVLREAAPGEHIPIKDSPRLELRDLLGTDDRGVFLVAAEAYGRSGKRLAHFAPTADAATLKNGLVTALGEHRSAIRDERQHIREGIQKGIRWESELPVSDPGKTRRRRAGGG